MATTPRSEMRILTVRNPWAHAIIHLGKDVENRVRNIAGDYRGPVAIHVAQGLGSYNETETALQAVHLASGQDVRRTVTGGPLHGGRIIGVVDLVDAHRAQSSDMKPPICWQPADSIGWVPFDGVDPYPDFAPRMCSPWGQQDGYHLVLSNPLALSRPIPFKGALGLRRLDADTISQIEEQLV